MPSMIDTYDSKLISSFISLIVIIKDEFRVPSILGHYKVKTLSSGLCLHCVMGPGSYNDFIILYLALRCCFMH